MNPNLESKYNYQAFGIMFLFTLITWIILFYLFFPSRYWNSSIGLLILISTGFIMALFAGAMMMSILKRITIKTSFDNKEEFINELNILLFKIGYTKDFNQDNFFSYKPSLRGVISSVNINITLNQHDAEITGPNIPIKKLEKALLIV